MGGPVPAARFGGLDGGCQGSEKNFTFCIHIWIPHEILSILSTDTWRENVILPPTICRKNSGAEFGPDLPNILAISKRGGGG